MSYDKNPYYNPDAFDPPLHQEAFLDMTIYDYSFDLRVVWSTSYGAVYTAYDSGCSCPTPFEDFTSVNDLTTVVDDLEGLDNTPRSQYTEPPYITFDQLREEAREFGQRSDEDRYYEIPADQDAIARYLADIDRLEEAMKL